MCGFMAGPPPLVLLGRHESTGGTSGGWGGSHATCPEVPQSHHPGRLTTGSM